MSKIINIHEFSVKKGRERLFLDEFGQLQVPDSEFKYLLKKYEATKAIVMINNEDWPNSVGRSYGFANRVELNHTLQRMIGDDLATKNNITITDLSPSESRKITYMMLFFFFLGIATGLIGFILK